jgi:hypothetical protein
VKKREVKEEEKQENERKREVDSERRRLEKEGEEQQNEQDEQKDEVEEEEEEEEEDEDEDEEEDTDDSYFDTTDEDDGFNSDGVHADEIAGKNSCNITTLTHLRMDKILATLLLTARRRIDKNGSITDIGLVSRHCLIGLFGLMVMALVMFMTIVCVLAFAGRCSLLRFGFNSALHLHLCIGSCCGLRSYFCINCIHFFSQMFLR